MQARRVWLAVVGVALLAACGKAPEDDRPGKPVATRQQHFKAMIRAFEPMGVMLREPTVWDTARFMEHWREFRALVDAPWGLFREDTCYGPAKVTAAACTDVAGLHREADTFRQAAAELGAAIERSVSKGHKPDSAQLAMIKAAYDRVYESCQSCHRQYRRK